MLPVSFQSAVGALGATNSRHAVRRVTCPAVRHEASGDVGAWAISNRWCRIALADGRAGGVVFDDRAPAGESKVLRCAAVAAACAVDPELDKRRGKGLIKACANSLPMACTAFAPKFKLPMAVRFVMACEPNRCRTLNIVIRITYF